ncbi:MAG: alpha/beta hydrolase [Clostridia bacterium]|nr:alpha/beta hydrolase [Clostridia bacterium]
MLWMWIAAGLLLLWAGISYGMTRKMFRNMCCRWQEEPKTEEWYLERLRGTPIEDRIPQARAGMDWLRNTPHEEVWMQSRDGLMLYGRLYRNEHWNGKVALLFHGYQSCVAHDFHTSVRHYDKLGFHLLVVDQRAHGKSEGKYICFGAKERLDAVDWCKEMMRRFGEDVPILLSGLSMGATTVLMAAGVPELPANVRGIVADCGFVQAYEEFRHVLKIRFHLPAFPMLLLCDRICLHRAGYSIRKHTTLQALAQSNLPVLLYHGTADRFVPPDNAVRMKDALGGRAELILVEGATHGLSWTVDEDRCAAALTRFTERIFGTDAK